MYTDEKTALMYENTMIHIVSITFNGSGKSISQLLKPKSKP
jgi:hypothetical protein